jgi:hypothetical protein
MYGPARQIGEEISEAGEYLGRVAAVQRKARDVATLTEFETGFDEAIGVRAVELKSNANIHPDDYYPMLAQYREDLFRERSQGLRGDLQPLAKAKAYKGTERTMIDVKAEGAALATKRALGVLDVYEDHVMGKMLTEGNEGQYKILQDQLRQKYTEYQEAGYLSADDRFLREHKAGERLIVAGVEMDMAENGKDTLARLQKGEYAGLTPENRVKLIDKAQTERREQAEWQDNQDRRAEKAIAVVQNENESKYRERIYATGGGPGALKMISEARLAGEIGPDQHDRLMSFAIRLQTERANQGAAAANRAYSLAAKAEIQARRQAENLVGTLEADMIANRPGPDGQLISPESLLNMAISQKIPGSVAGEVARRMEARTRLIDSDTRDGIKEQFNMAIKTAEAAFEQQGLMPTKHGLVQQSFALFQEQLTSMVFRDKADPFEARDKIINQFMAAAASGLRTRMTPILANLPTPYRPTEGEGIEAQKAQLKNDFKAGAIPYGEYKRIGNHLKELEGYPPFKSPAKKATSTSQAPAPAPAPMTEAPKKSGGMFDWLKLTTPEGEGRQGGP